MAEKQNYDIIIVGGGLVGASLAGALGTTSLRVAIIEAAPWFTDTRPPSYDDRVIALSYASYRIFQGLGIWDQIAPAATAIKHIHVSDQGQLGFTRLDSKILEIPALGYVVSARHLGQVLQKTLAPLPVDILAPALLSQIRYQNEGLEIQLKLDNQPHTLQTRLLVAADGGHSQVRQQLGFTTHETDYKQTAVIANVTLEHCHQNTAYERFTPSGPLALLPMQHHNCSLVWTIARTQTNEVMELDDDSFLSSLQRQFGWRLGRFMQVGQRHAYPLHLIRVQKSVYPRVVIIGNAAHTLHPVAGQGLNLGLRDVASLAEAIVESLRLGNDLGNEAILQRYAAWQQSDQQAITTLTDGLVRGFSNKFLPLVVARNLGLLITDALPFLKKRLVRQMAGLNGHPSRLVRGLPLIN